ncbi:unnamed protein product [Phytophthora fragariaefolia]|uniref:Unnamed protein product n=1 Tax=Phytophthora fragariaefolia TaxID=1490495 RepID=A0A9W6XKN4_9STRA|nr:unnamed protein product [Phytophthora fragariaefolia]
MTNARAPVHASASNSAAARGSRASGSSSTPGELLRRHAQSQRSVGGTSPSGTPRRSRRCRKKRTADLSGDAESREARKMLKLALAKSVVETKMVHAAALPQGAVFYPTLEQFADPINIESEARKTGISKIVPPQGWRPPFAVDFEDESVQFDTRKQKIHELQVGGGLNW